MMTADRMYVPMVADQQELDVDNIQSHLVRERFQFFPLVTEISAYVLETPDSKVTTIVREIYVPLEPATSFECGEELEERRVYSDGLV